MIYSIYSDDLIKIFEEIQDIIKESIGKELFKDLKGELE